jgi:hypothetical protein
MRKNKIDRDEGRDISEKIALGMLKGTGGKLTGEALYDGRLFNQSAGMDAGFGGEDEYNTYTKPLFDRTEAGSIYRPRQSAEDMYGDADTQMKQLSDTSRFKADKGFKGADASAAAGTRDAPVQFERAEAAEGGRRSDDRDRDRDRHGDRHGDRERGHRDDGAHSRRGDDRDGDRDQHRRDRSPARDSHRDSHRERDRDSRGEDRGSGSGGRRRGEEEDPFGIRDIVDDGSRKRSRRD